MLILPRVVMRPIGSLPLLVNVRPALTAGDSDADGIPDAVEVAEGTDPFARDNDVFSPTLASARLFAMQQYRDFVNREADPFGLSFWSNAVFTGTWTRPAVIDAFLNNALDPKVSTEGANPEGLSIMLRDTFGLDVPASVLARADEVIE